MIKVPVPGPLAALLTLLDEFGPVQQAGDEFRCFCPAHDDKGPSLYVGLGHEPGHLIMNCKAGCPYTKVAEALKVDPTEAFYFDPDAPLVEFEVDGRGPSPNGHAGGNGKPKGEAHASPFDPVFCNRVYAGLQARLKLLDADREALRLRGLDDAAIDRFGYRSARTYEVNQAVGQICRSLVEKGIAEDSLLGVPGFGIKFQSIRFFDLNGLLIPIRDAQGRILVFKVRRSDGGKPKYLYASGCEGGARCESPCHVPLGTPAEASTVRVTEGEMKADIIFARSATPTLGVGGVELWPRAVPVLEAMGAETVLLAFDSDYRTNPGVARQLQACAKALAGEGFEVKFEVWPPALGKGLDDVLAAGGTPEVVDVLPDVEEAQGEAEAAPSSNGGGGGDEDAKDRPATLADVVQFMAKIRWLWEGYIAAARIVGIAAFEGIGKTRFALDLARRIFYGLCWPDGTRATLAKGTPTLWVCSDGQVDEIVETARAMGLPLEALYLNTPADDPYGGTELGKKDMVRLAKYAERIRPGLIVIDSMTNVTDLDVCRATENRAFMAPLRDLAQRLQIPIALLIHLSKDGQVLGRRAKGLTRTLIHLDCPDPEQPERLRLWVEKSYAKKPSPLGVTMDDCGNLYDDQPPGPADPVRKGRPATERGRAEQFLRHELKEKNDQLWNDLVLLWEQRSKGGRRTLGRVVDDMKKRGDLTTTGGEGAGQQMVLHLVKKSQNGEDHVDGGKTPKP